MSLVETESPNQALVTLERNDSVWFRPAYLQSRRLGRRLIPPWMSASPIARLLHQCYWLASLNGSKGENAQSLVAFSGPSATGRFFCLKLAENEKYSVCLGHLAAVIIENDRPASKPMTTHIKGHFSLSCWLIGRPLPVIFKGPARVLLYGENLSPVTLERTEHLVQQVVAFDARRPFNVVPTETDGGLWSEFTNGLTLDSRLSVDQGILLDEQILPNRLSPFRLYKRLFGHLALAGLVALIISLLWHA
jgi:hypothetical protein